jgi:hypothetical protein
MWNGAQWVPNQAVVTPTPGTYGPPWARPYESARFRATLVGIFLGANVVSVLGSLVLAAAAALAILVVREVTARQDRKNELIATGQLA